MFCQSYGKAEPCLTSGGGAAIRQASFARKASAHEFAKYNSAVDMINA
jgi:hypothetical protein